MHVDGAGHARARVRPRVDAGTPDVDLYVYRSDRSGFRRAAGRRLRRGRSRTRRVAPRRPRAAATSSRAVSFATGTSGFAGSRGAGHLAAPSSPDVDASARAPGGARQRPTRRRRLAAGGGREPARSRRARRGLSRLRRIPRAYVSRIATAVSFDRGARWLPLGAVSAPRARTRRSPSPTWRRAADHQRAVRVAGSSLRRWTRPSASDVAAAAPGKRRRRSRAPSAGRSTSAPCSPPAAPAADGVLGADDRPRRVRAARPSCAGARPTRGVSWVGSAALPGAGRRRALRPVRRRCRARAPARRLHRRLGRHARRRPRRVGARRGLGRAQPDGIAGARRCAPRASGRSRTASPATASATSRCWRWPRARPGLPRLSPPTAAAMRTCGLVRFRRRGRALGRAGTVGAYRRRADQFQPSLAVTRGARPRSFLDRRLDPAGRFADEWLATSTRWRRDLDASGGSHTTHGTRRRRPALADGRPARRSPGAGRRRLRARGARRRSAPRGCSGATATSTTACAHDAAAAVRVDTQPPRP